MIRGDEAGRPLTVSELAQEIKRRLRPLNAVLVKGEVTGLRQGGKGHYSFTIRDGAAVVEAFLFAGDARRLPALPEDGQVFLFRGRVDYWHQYGRLRLVVDWVEFDDAGRLRAQLEQLRRKLEAEGAFDPSRKRPLPFLPRRVGLITSPTGAVIHDLQETIRERFPNMDIALYPALVQGTASPGSVAAALGRANRDGDCDVLVVARGGGSFEELYAFNTEPVARAILASRIPVVTALGHTSDRTLADLVADADCRTPTEAGARVVPVKRDLAAALADRDRRLAREVARRVVAEAGRLETCARRLRQCLPALHDRRAQRLERLRAELGRLSPAQQLERRRGLLGHSADRLAAATERLLAGRRAELERRRAPERLERGLAARVAAAEQAVVLRRGRIEAARARALDERARDLGRRRAAERLDRALAGRLARESERLGAAGRRLLALGPEQVLARGYAIATDASTGAVLRDAAQAPAGSRVRVRLAAGTLSTVVESDEP